MESLVSLVIVNWNRKNELKECLESIKNQTYKLIEVIIVDNLSTDGSIEMVREVYPEVNLIVMPDSSYGACETFNIGFSNAKGEYTGILDDDITLPNDWVEKIINKFKSEPISTAIISTKVIEPGMPDDYLNSKEYNREKYYSTFVGCGSMARSALIKEAGYYDKKLFIHVNERDLALRLLKKGYRILHYPSVCTYHKKPFGIHLGNRSLYYHLRNYIWVLFKHYCFMDIMRFFMVGIGVKRMNKGNSNQILGVIGLKESIFQNKGGISTACKALFDAMTGLPYCFRNRSVYVAEEFL
ncbi:glycosyltransferase family 2 protein [Methanospirillum sp. J.3.6.1-F.2.7.3]|uniref:Glycosyltransferase family 2 protein n=1 Tax=Methanospirillum purgamenti TaxID=2834276 RepID=A0A8E7AYN9_9EURY|nr:MULTISPECIES: glycosyltransferase family 2 protein [Methanospirillum]MDX8549503.1 glycosyltransferase family 2 protein [Methanospirillum hungatei]QVV89215.1 glycosyltransferase family 2 protein [Methanospirillum sp. J.3.6.1-F.2.7.3]